MNGKRKYFFDHFSDVIGKNKIFTFRGVKGVYILQRRMNDLLAKPGRLPNGILRSHVLDDRVFREISFNKEARRY
jgi:hypothetical protein